MSYGKKPPSGLAHPKYHSSLATLFYLRGLNHADHFLCASDFDGIGAFGDFVFIYRENERVVASFFQILQFSQNSEFGISSINEYILHYFLSFRKVLSNIPWLEEQFGEEINDIELICYTDEKLHTELSFPNADHIVDGGGLVYCLHAGSREWELFEELKKFREFLLELSYDIEEGNSVMSLEESVDLFKSVVSSEEILSRVEMLRNDLTRGGVNASMIDIGGIPTKDEFKEFLEKFKVFHSQANDVKIMELVKDDFLKVCGAQYVDHCASDSEQEFLANSLNEIFANFVNGIFEWVETGEEWISRYSRIWGNAVHRVILAVCHNLVKDVSQCNVQFTEDSLEKLSEQILENKIICVDAQHSHTMLNLVKVTQVLQGLEFFILDMEGFLKHKNIVLKAMERFWCSLIVIETSDAVISEFSSIMQDISKLMEVNIDIRLILVTQDANEVVIPTLRMLSCKYERHIDIVSWVSMSAEFQTSFLNKAVLFQGVETTLGVLLSAYPEIFKEFHGDFLYTLIITSDFVIGSNLPCVNDFIPRTLTRAVSFNPTILWSKFSNTLIVVTGSPLDDIIAFIPEGENYHVFNPAEDTITTFQGIHIVVLEEITHEQLFTNIINDANTSAHCFNYSDNKLTWKWSLGDMKHLDPHIINDKRDVFRFENPSSFERITVISGEPDIGKSTFLSHLAQDIKLSHPSLWVITFNLSHHEEFLNNAHLGNQGILFSLIKDAATYPNRGPLSDMLFYHYWIDSNIAIFIDGFEEVQRSLVEETTHMINQIKTNMKHVFLTCRPNLATTICHGLCTYPFDLLPVDTVDQRRYLLRKWRHKIPDEKRLSVFIEAIISLLRNSISEQDKKICGTPLFTTLAALAYEPELQNFAQTGNIMMPQKLNLVYLYDKYVEKHCYDFFISQRGGENVTLDMFLENKKRLIETYRLLAVMLIITKDDLKLLESSSDQYDINQDFKKVIDVIGTGSLVTMVDNSPEFIHKTLPEYFLGMWMADSYSFTRHFIEHRMLEPRYTEARLWMDRALCSSNELHWAAVAADEATTAEILAKGVDINSLDSGGRTALHIAACHNHPNIVRLLLMAGADDSLADLVLGWRPLKYTDRLRSWATMNILLEEAAGKNLKADMVSTNKILDNDAMLNSLLITACESGFIHLLEYLHSQGVDVKKVIDFEGSTALHVAAEAGRTELVRYLLSGELEGEGSGRLCGNVLRLIMMGLHGRVKLDVNTTRNDGSTAVLLAAQEGRSPTLEVLIEWGANIEQPKANGTTPMLAAVAENQTDAVRILLAAGAKPLKDDGDGTTPLHAAAVEGHAGLVRLLLEFGADPLASDGSNATPLHWAAAGGHLRCAEALVRAGAIVNAKDLEYRTSLHWAAIEGQSALVRFLLQRGADPKLVAQDGGTAVHYAARENRPGTLYTFQRLSVDINILSPDESTPLHWASYRGHDPAVKMLLEMGADRDAANREGYTPLHLAASKGHATLVRRFLGEGAHPDGSGTARRAPPLHLAAKGEHAACVRVLLEARATTDARDAVGATALHWAAWCGHEKTIALLLRAGADATLADNHRSTPLHWASGAGHERAVKAILRADTNYNATNRDGDTCLHWAAREGHANVVASLLEAGANPIIRNGDGDSPADLAGQARHSEIVCMLEAASAQLQTEQFYDITAEENVKNEYDTPEGVHRKYPMDMRKISTMQVLDGDTFYDATPRVSSAVSSRKVRSWDEDDRGRISLVRMSLGVNEYGKLPDDTPEVHKVPTRRHQIVRPSYLPVASVVTRVRVDSDQSNMSTYSVDEYSSVQSKESLRANIVNGSELTEETSTPTSNDVLFRHETGQTFEVVQPTPPSMSVPISSSVPSSPILGAFYGAKASVVRFARKAIKSDSSKSIKLPSSPGLAQVHSPVHFPINGAPEMEHEKIINIPFPEERPTLNGRTEDFIANEGMHTMIQKNSRSSSYTSRNLDSMSKQRSDSMEVNTPFGTPYSDNSDEDTIVGLAAGVHNAKTVFPRDVCGKRNSFLIDRDHVKEERDNTDFKDRNMEFRDSGESDASC